MGREAGRKIFVFVVLYKMANSVHVPNMASPVGTKIWSLILKITSQVKCLSVFSKVALGARSLEGAVRHVSA